MTGLLLFQYSAMVPAPLDPVTATNTLFPETKTELALPLSLRMTVLPFFQYTAVEVTESPFTPPAAYTSFPEIKMELAKLLPELPGNMTGTLFFQYFARYWVPLNS